MTKGTIALPATLLGIALAGPGILDNLGATAANAAEERQQSESATRTTVEISPPWSQKLPVAQRFELVLGGEAVLDKETRLVWVKSPTVTKQPWVEAQNSCRWAVVGGRLGWRLPSVEELASLVDPEVAGTPKISTGHPFVNVRPASYWSVDSLETDSKFAWMVGLDEGKLNTYDKTKDMYAWCVRGSR